MNIRQLAFRFALTTLFALFISGLSARTQAQTISVLVNGTPVTNTITLNHGSLVRVTGIISDPNGLTGSSLLCYAYSGFSEGVSNHYTNNPVSASFSLYLFSIVPAGTYYINVSATDASSGATTTQQITLILK